MSTTVAARLPDASARERCRALLAGQSVEPLLAEASGSTFADLEALLQVVNTRAASVARMPSSLEPRALLLRFAPTGFALGASLEHASNVSSSHEALGAACVEEVHRVLGGGTPARASAQALAGLLTTQALVPQASLSGLLSHAEIRDVDLNLPALALSVGKGGARWLPEALGVHLASVKLGAPAELWPLFASVPGLAAWLPESQELQLAMLSLRRILGAYAACSPSWSRVYRGAEAYLLAAQTWRSSLVPNAVPDPWRAMLELLRAKAPYACGFHRAIQLQGGNTQQVGPSLEQHFAAAKFDALALAKALAGSPWVVAGKPEDSLLLTRSCAFGGPMFGIFSAAEIQILSAWITALPHALPPHADDDAESTELRTAEPAAARAPGAVPTWRNKKSQTAKLGAPALYHALLNTPYDPVTRQQSWTFVDGLLTQASRSLSAATLRRRGLPAEAPTGAATVGTPSLLQSWANEQIQQQLRPAAERSAWLACIGKADALWLLSQLAPMAFVDGAWLAGMARVDHQHSTLAPGLFEIYRDELGAGQVAQHHGNVMRRTLLAHGVTLPHCSEPAFRDWPGFTPAAFYLGCHWLAVAEHSAEFFSELLGVNLATELAGVGTDYFNAAALLRQNGIDPYFFELHNSIDNAAGGHTAWSVYAIDEYLRAINEQSGPSATNEAWRRIWAGYDSYALASKPLRTAIALHLGPRLVWRRLRGRSGKTQASRQPSSSAGGV